MNKRFNRILNVLVQLLAILILDVSYSDGAGIWWRKHGRVRCHRRCKLICCRDGADDCACVLSPYYVQSNGTTIYYANYHPDCDDCNFVQPCFWMSDDPIDPQYCYDDDEIGECEAIPERCGKWTMLASTEPANVEEHGYDLTADSNFKFSPTFFEQPLINKHDVVRIRLPDSSEIQVKVFFLFVGIDNPKIRHHWISVGVEVHDDGTTGEYPWVLPASKHFRFSNYVYQFYYPRAPGLNKRCIVRTNHR